MPYITTIAKERNFTPQQISISDFLNDLIPAEKFTEQLKQQYENPRRSIPYTKTEFRHEMPYEILRRVNFADIFDSLSNFCDKYKDLYEVPRESLYEHFEIPKKSIDPATGRHKMRPIDAPNLELKNALYELRSILTDKCGALYHTSAYAYIPGRCAVDSIRVHQANTSHWFLKTDMSNFFGNVSEDFLHYMLGMIFPFSEIYKIPGGSDLMHRAFNLCFLNGGLPQGTPISPMLTNLIMIPIDHRLANALHRKNDQRFVYTRYADDILISSYFTFNADKMVNYLNDVLREFHASFSINPDKTRYASGNGHNFNLGVCLNEKNQITIGYKQKKEFRATLVAFYKAYSDGDIWPLNELQTINGLYEYYRSIEPKYWAEVMDRYQKKYGNNIIVTLRRAITEA